MNKNEKDMDALLHAMEHPEQYSDDQIEKMMSDSENREAYNLMVDSENAYRKDDLSDDDINTEWNKIAAKSVEAHHRRLFRIAASIIGFIMVSGIVYATIAIGFHHHDDQTTEAVEQTIAKPSKQNVASVDTTTAKPKIKEYRDATLVTVIGDMATYYNKKVSFANDEVKSVRIYIKWDQANSLEETIDKLNHFEKFTINIENNKIIVR